RHLIVSEQADRQMQRRLLGADLLVELGRQGDRHGDVVLYIIVPRRTPGKAVGGTQRRSLELNATRFTLAGHATPPRTRLSPSPQFGLAREAGVTLGG